MTPPARTTTTLPPVAVTLLVALVAHALLWSFRADDVDLFLVPWFDHIRQAGLPDAFAAPFGNYMPAYLYLLAAAGPLAALLPVVTVIKLLSVAGTAMLAASMWRLLRALDRVDAARGAALVFVLPTGLINAPLLAQCDAMWAAPCVTALAMAIERRHARMLAWFGLGCAIKLQAAFLGPFIIAVLIQRRVPLLYWGLAPLTAFATLVPAWAAGWPIGDLLTVYVRQTGHFAQLSLNAPNIWAIVQLVPIGLPLGGLAMATAIGASGVYIAHFSSHGVQPRVLVGIALLASLTVVGLLPRMHERYFFLADVTALAYALTTRNRDGWIVAALVQAGSMLALLGYLSGLAVLPPIGALMMIAATARVLAPLTKPAANDAGPRCRTAARIPAAL